MSWAVMQTDWEPPTAEQLKNAFAQVPELTALDAAVLGRDAFGVLARGFDAAQAAAMQAALAAQGVETELVPEGTLTELPAPRKLSRVEFTPEALRIDNLLGQILALEWHDILVIAAGHARLTDFKTELVDKVKFVRNPRGRYVLAAVTESNTTEEQKDHLLLEIITCGAAQRYHITADHREATLLFQCLGERRTRRPATDLCLLVQDLAKFAPAAVLNHGAFFMRESNDPAFLYPSKGAFYREIIWLLWMIATGRARP